jgi:hypothetical protein
LFRKVRDKVREKAARRQEPFLYGSLGSEPLYFKGSVEDTCKNRSQGLLEGQLPWIERSWIQETIAGKASRGSIGEIVKRIRTTLPTTL